MTHKENTMTKEAVVAELKEIRKIAELNEIMRRVENLITQIEATSNPNLFCNEIQLDKKLAKVLTKLGFRQHCIGYDFIIYAIKMILKRGKNNLTVTRDIYPEIASKFDTSVSCAERGIRDEIERAWTYGDMELQDMIFGSSILESKGKPTNLHFLVGMADYISRN